jgi:hypothetical protein
VPHLKVRIEKPQIGQSLTACIATKHHNPETNNNTTKQNQNDGKRCEQG